MKQNVYLGAKLLIPSPREERARVRLSIYLNFMYFLCFFVETFFVIKESIQSFSLYFQVWIDTTNLFHLPPQARTSFANHKYGSTRDGQTRWNL